MLVLSIVREISMKTMMKYYYLLLNTTIRMTKFKITDHMRR